MNDYRLPNIGDFIFAINDGKDPTTYVRKGFEIHEKIGANEIKIHMSTCRDHINGFVMSIGNYAAWSSSWFFVKID